MPQNSDDSDRLFPQAEAADLNAADSDPEDDRVRDHGLISAVMLKELKENAGDDESYSSSDEEEEVDDKTGRVRSPIETRNGHAGPDHDHGHHYRHHKAHVERRFHRSLIWGSIAWFLGLGRLFSRAGVKGAHLAALRRVTKISQGYKRATLPEVLHFKDRINGIKVRIYRPAEQLPGQKLPCVLFIHGGGWVMCTARTYHAFTLELCRDVKAIVISIDYNLAPENPWPGPLEDCLKVTRAVLNADIEPSIVGDNLAGFIDVKRVAIAGDSAGGNLSCATALELIRNKTDASEKLAAALLICPAVQAISTGFESHQRYGKNSTARSGWFLSLYAGVNDPNPSILRACKEGRHVPAEFLAKFNERYLKNWREMGNKAEPLVVPPLDEQHTEAVPEVITKLSLSPRAWPMLESDDVLRQLPVTFIQTCSEDSLRDEGLVFAERLRQCGVGDVRFFYLPRAQHCEPIFHNTIPTKAAKLGYQQICVFLKDVLFAAPQQTVSKSRSKAKLEVSEITTSS